jgi:16S rRNA (guanine527-N7)-methyltransferase
MFHVEHGEIYNPPVDWNSLTPYFGGPLPPALLRQLEIYLDLLLRWNAKMNLTAIRDPEAIIRRHFGESLFVARQLPPPNVPRGTLLDHGSGAGFPGLPIALARPEFAVTLSESQQKKASFLREVIRATGAANVQVHAGRTEAILPPQRFDFVTLRAVDDAATAYPIAADRVAAGGSLAALEAGHSAAGLALASVGFVETSVWELPESEAVLRLYARPI